MMVLTSLDEALKRSIERKRKMSKPKLGTGRRFAKLESSLAHAKGIKNPGALAASIGRKKYGDAKMSKLSAHGRARRG